MKLNLNIILALFLLCLNLSCVSLPQDNQFAQILAETNTVSPDLTFMRLNNYLRDYPGSTHEKEIKFAIGEYHLGAKNYREAIYSLSNYIKNYPVDPGTIFAQALLYKAISAYNQEPRLIAKIKENFFAKSVFLLFSQSRVKQYKSILNNTYEIKEYIDRLEVTKNNGLFITITP